MQFSLLPAVIRLGLFAAVAFAVCLTNTAQAGLTGPLPSYARPTADGKHLLVMLSRVPIADDSGNECILPDGQKVRLRTAFPTGGLYRLGSCTPVWKADWYGELEHVVLSDDGRYAVRINRFGDGGYPEKPLSWGIRFYDRGTQIKSHDVADLVGFPSLMEFTTWDWHFLWYDDSFPGMLHRRIFEFKTSTRETYQFDITTGEIVAEHRFWRNAARAGIATIVLIAVAMLILRQRLKSRTATVPIAGVPTKGDFEAASLPRRPTFGLRTMFLITAAAAIFCWIPHVATFALSVVLALQLTRWSRRAAPVASRRRWRPLRWSVTCLAWLGCYTLGLGPALSVFPHLPLPNDVRRAALQITYAPLIRQRGIVPITAFPLARWYLKKWGAD